MFSAPPREYRKLSGPDSHRSGFSLVEVVIAIGVISFALLSILGVLSMAMTVHQDASIDSVLSIMSESALQEVRNYNRPTNSLVSGSYSFSKLASFSTTTPGYIYFDQDGQITADAYWNAKTSTGATAPVASTATTQSTEVGINMNGSTYTANNGPSGMPLTTALAASSLPATTYYTCKITTSQPTLFNGATTTSMYFVQLTFSWPPGASAANQHTRTVVASISNNAN
jgi:Tfp pilus assembly protein PilV